MKYWVRLQLWSRGCDQIRVPIPSLKGTKGNDQKWAECTQVLKCYVDKLQVQANSGWPKENLPGRKYLLGNSISPTLSILRPQKGPRDPGLWLTAGLELSVKSQASHRRSSSWSWRLMGESTSTTAAGKNSGPAVGTDPSVSSSLTLHPLFISFLTSLLMFPNSTQSRLGFPGELCKQSQLGRQSTHIHLHCLPIPLDTTGQREE